MVLKTPFDGCKRNFNLWGHVMACFIRDLLRMNFSLTCLMIQGIDPYIKSEAK